MPSRLLDRVQSKRFEKYRKFTIVYSISFILFGIFKVFINPNFPGSLGIAYWVDTLLLYFIFPVGSLFIFSKRNEKNRVSQFIEWWDDKLIYKSTNSPAIIEIGHSDISTIFIKLDNIEISTQTNKTYVINLFDYTDYDLRLRIKSNFEKYKVAG